MFGGNYQELNDLNYNLNLNSLSDEEFNASDVDQEFDTDEENDMDQIE